jgi:CHAT domain-containing protein
LFGSRIVHIASHGALNGDSPLFSSIRLAMPAHAFESSDNGRLETHEVLSLRIRSGLIFLSGCETALGPSWSSSFTQGDDYATLSQAFLFAGAQNVVATLWRIDDRGAADFADRFYERLGSVSPVAALAAAQRGFIADTKYSLPYYWAAYTTSGSGRLD